MLAKVPLIIWAVIMGLDGGGIVLMQSLTGAGAPRQVMQITVVMQWVIFLPVAWLVGPVWGFGLVGIWAAQAIYRMIQGALFIARWNSRGWTSIEV